MMSSPQVEDQCPIDINAKEEFVIQEEYFTQELPDDSANEENSEDSEDVEIESESNDVVEKYDKYAENEIAEHTSNLIQHISDFIEEPTYAIDLEITTAILEQNYEKNRYMDIMPYDKTRFVLEGKNDYINANYVFMNLENQENRKWIAAQGPLLGTTNDFWNMVYQSKAELIVMVTQTIEKGRQKCHAYWENGPIEFGDQLSVQLLSSDNLGNGIMERKLSFLNKIDNSERQVRQIQFIDWPDHGVPHDPSHFLSFLFKINSLKNELGADKPTIVHCSAGVGRTGVTIMLDLAIENIKRQLINDPILILKEMRRQRACLIQTPHQFEFVCKTIILLYKHFNPQNLEEL